MDGWGMDGDMIDKEMLMKVILKISEDFKDYFIGRKLNL